MTSFSCFDTSGSRAHRMKPKVLSKAVGCTANLRPLQPCPRLNAASPSSTQNGPALPHSSVQPCLDFSSFFLCLERPPDCLNCSFKTPSRNYLWWGLPFLPLGRAQAFYSA